MAARCYVLCPTNILQRRKMDKLFALYRPHMVFHAAAYKHVPLMEASPDEAVLNNIEGTLVMAEIAGRYGVERFINISTDKAVNPVNVMGATKRAGELIVRMLSERYPETMFASVRFGNVLGSQGSVIPIFKGQIEGGGPVVITHPEMTRYFMLIEEAVQLVLQAAIMVDDPVPDSLCSLDTFVLEMGDPVPIIELAQRMIEFYWKEQTQVHRGRILWPAPRGEAGRAARLGQRVPARYPASPRGQGLRRSLTGLRPTVTATSSSLICSS